MSQPVFGRGEGGVRRGVFSSTPHFWQELNSLYTVIAHFSKNIFPWLFQDQKVIFQDLKCDTQKVISSKFIILINGKLSLRNFTFSRTLSSFPGPFVNIAWFSRAWIFSSSNSLIFQTFQQSKPLMILKLSFTFNIHNLCGCIVRVPTHLKWGNSTIFQGYFWKTVVTLIYVNKISSNFSHLFNMFLVYAAF